METSVQLGTILSSMADAFPVHPIWPGISDFSQTAAATLITAMWQGAVVAIALAVCLRLAPRITAAHRFAIWTTGFVVVAGLPFLPMLTHLAGATATLASAEQASLASAQANPWLHLDARWSIILAGLWLTASLFRAVDLGLHSLQLRTLWQTAIPVAFPPDCASLPSIPGRKPIELCTSSRVERPSVIGFLAPRILIPDWLFDQLSPAELDQIVLHEAEHLRRADDWTNLLQKLCLVLFPLNPALIWIERQLCLEREMACDDGVIRRTHAPRAYAACLTSLAERGLQRRTGALPSATLSLGAWHRRPELVRRVHSVLLRKRALGTLGARSLFAGFGFSLIFGAVELARCPQLVAFVPMQNTQTARASGATPIRRVNQQKAAFAQIPIPQLVSSRSTFQPRVMYLKAQLPTRQAQPVRSVRAVKLLSPVLTAANPEPQALKSLMSDQQSRSTSEPAQAQAWIVLTTWEQVEQSGPETVQLTGGTTQLAADYDTNSESSQAGQVDQTVQADQIGQPGQPGSKQSGPIFSRITITRLIFRVLPVTSVSSSSAAGPVRTGWLLLQL